MKIVQVATKVPDDISTEQRLEKLMTNAMVEVKRKNDRRIKEMRKKLREEITKAKKQYA